MPRIYNSLSEPVDYCKDCFPASEEEAFEDHGHEGDGPDDRGNCFWYDADHPPYEETDYRCDNKDCRKELTKKDD